MNRQVFEQLTAWLDQHFDQLLEDLKAIVAIPSVATYDEEGTPFGQGCKQALDAMLALAEGYGLQTRNFDDRYGMMTAHPSDESIAVWTHLDVVPVGGDWRLTKPFEPVIHGDFLIGRGADDNKGPAVGIMYMLRALKELGIPTRHGLKLYVGCDEEHGMRDVDHFALNQPAEKLSVIGDCGFPVCYGEKGLISANIVSAMPMESVTALKAGIAGNIVPDTAMMCVEGAGELHGSGLSAHSAFPEGGVNAIHEVMKAALNTGKLTGNDAKVIDFMKRVNDDFLGTALGINAEDEVSGYTTCCGTMASLRADGRAVLQLNIRSCLSAKTEELISAMEATCAAGGCTLEVQSCSPSHYFPPENPVVDAMTDVYNEITGKNSKPYVMGGGTYARHLPNALGFGLGGMERDMSQFETGHGNAHQPDEGLHLPNYKKGLVIFAMGLLAADEVLP